MKVYSFKEFLNESLNFEKYFFFIKTGLSKEWISEIEYAYNRVSDQAKPTCICGFNKFKSITGRVDVINKVTQNNYGVSMNLPSIELPINLMPESYKEKMKNKGFYDERLYELKTTFKLDQMFYNSMIDIVAFNNKYLTPDDISKRKHLVNEQYKAKTGNDYFVNFTGEATIYHEFGHVLNNRKYISDKSEWKSLSQQWYQECKCDLIKNPSEAFSEAFANYYMTDGDKLPEYIVEFLKRYI